MQFPQLIVNRCEVENMKASLLGCGEEKQGGGKLGSTEEKCLYEFNLTLSFQETMGRSALTNTLCFCKHGFLHDFHLEIQDSNA